MKKIILILISINSILLSQYSIKESGIISSADITQYSDNRTSEKYRSDAEDAGSENNSRELVHKKLTSAFFTKLYSDTYNNLIDRIESDGYLQESITGNYEGEYCRTVGAIVPLLIETKQLQKAELLIRFVINFMEATGESRVPHIIGKERKNNTFSQEDSVYLIQDTDQIDGQAHNILAWAELALFRGPTSFEDSTWLFMKNMMDRTTHPPYMGSREKGFIRDLVYNYNFEHSRIMPMNYDLLTQCFTGAALESMIVIAQRRNDLVCVKRWIDKLTSLKAGVEKFLTRNADGKQIYLELLSKEGNEHKPFLGFSWVNFSPVAARWEPLQHLVLVNTINEMEKTAMKKWNGFNWLPMDWWPDGDFSDGILGKGIGWEIEYARKEKDWGRILEILSLIEIIQKNQPIYMEYSFLSDSQRKTGQRISQNDFDSLKNPSWKIVDAGNGEQISWWCWAMARLRSDLGFSASPN